MFGHVIGSLSQQAAALPSLLPLQFLSGSGFGLVLGIIVTTLVVRWARLCRALTRFGIGLITMGPAVVACALWGAWVGIMTAKEMVIR